MDWNKALYEMLRYLRNQLESNQRSPFSAQTFGMTDATFLNAVCLLSDSGYITGVSCFYDNNQRYVQVNAPQITMAGLQYVTQYEQQQQTQIDLQSIQKEVQTIRKKPSGCRVAIGLIGAIIGFTILIVAASSAWTSGLY